MEQIMKKTLVITTMAALVGAMFWLTGCESAKPTSGHVMAPASDKHVVACQKCYDMAVYYQQQAGDPGHHGHSLKSEKHMCEGCKGEVTTYMQDGKPMIKCPGCAPKGMACDKCASPKSKS